MEAFIYDAVRTPRGKGKKDGSLHGTTPLEFAATTLRAINRRNDLDTALVDDVVLGCVTPVGEHGACIGRVARLTAGRADQPLLRVRPGGREHGRSANHAGPGRVEHRRRRGGDVARAYGLGRWRVVGRSTPRLGPRLQGAPGHQGGPKVRRA